MVVEPHEKQLPSGGKGRRFKFSHPDQFIL